MYRILVVDNEDIIRNKIINSVSWNSLGFEIMDEAMNGRQALDIVNKKIPDVILTDIRMPIMDGIELIENISVNYPEIKLVIMSGFNDYEYLRQAIKNRVTDYLLKPTENSEFVKVFEKIKILLDEEKDEKLRYDKVRKQLFESLPFMREKFLNQLIRGFYKDANKIKDKMDFYDIEPIGEVVAVVVFEIDNFHIVTEEFSEEQKQLLRLSIVYAANENFSEMKLGVFFLGTNDEIIGICNMDVGPERLINVIQEIKKYILKYKGITFSVGVSEGCNDLSMLLQYNRQAIQALKQKVFLGTDSIILFKDIKDIENTDCFMYSFDTEKIINIIFYNAEGELSDCIDEVFCKFSNKVNRQSDYVDNICIELIAYVLRYARQFGVDFSDILQKRNSSYFEITKYDTINLKKEWLMGILESISYKIGHIRKNSASKLIETVKEYVRANYMNNSISLELVAEKVNKNSRYLSRIFKNETGENFVDYLTGLRIERAKKLIEDMSIKLYEITGMLGYADVSYFTKTFKKHTGMTPSEYRELSCKKHI